MKKMVRGMLISGAVVCAIGVGMFCVGAAFGGSEYVAKADLNKLDANARLDGGIRLEKTKIDGFDRIDAALNDANFSILPSEDQNYYLSYKIHREKTSEPVKYEVKDNTLKLTEKNIKQGVVVLDIDIGFISWLLGEQEKLFEEDEVILYVPENKILKGTKIVLRDGDLDAQSLMIQGNMEIESSYGDVSLQIEKACREILSLDVSTKYGDIEIAEEWNDGGSMLKESDDASYQRTAKSPEGTLRVAMQDGDFSLR